MRDLYASLGVPRDADQATIRKAYKKLAREFHPDLNQAPGASDRFKEVNAAHEVLGEETKRALYDEFGDASLRPGFDANKARAWGGSGGGGFGGMGGFGGGGMGVDDLFSGLFGGGRRARPRRDGPERGPDIEVTVRVELLDLALDEMQVVELRRPESCGTCQGAGGAGRSTCPVCRGTGRVQMSAFGNRVATPCSQCAGSGVQFTSECEDCGATGRTTTTQRLKVRMPAGVEDGQVIRLKGRGGDGKRGGPAGDVRLTVRIKAHPLLKRDGTDLLLDVPVTLSEAVLGGSVTVPTPDGAIKIKVPAGIRGGEKLRIRGRGLPKTGKERGNLYLVLRPTPPSGDDPELVRLVTELDALYAADVRADLEL